MFPTDTTGSERSRLQDKDPGRSGREKKGKMFERNFMKGGFAEISERELPMGCRRGMGGSLRWGGGRGASTWSFECFLCLPPFLRVHGRGRPNS